MMGADLGLLIGKMSNTTLAASEYAAVVNMNLFVALLCACIIIGHLMEESRWMNESITALVIVSVLMLIININFNSSVRVNLNLIFTFFFYRVYAQVLLFY